ncbi:hypothetical protein J7E88_32925 [Streptomyces sp. ISL-10]|uniref:hypothetical protein n=1 Tax=Streptomyces sp. ISL-10 TaxID=2819172 RepID=UPI001BE89192|nr:hypothetical protein [Streptomyces sp. ISL-10]MBT2369946.1 hypothetical protein [Streptomyces sp. ISL-10]
MFGLTSWLVDEIWHDERREQAIRAELLKHMREKRIEPPTADQISTVIRSALHQAEERATRGDGPSRWRMRASSSVCSPHARGWSRGTDRSAASRAAPRTRPAPSK